MRIADLTLTAFGRFQGRRLQLGPGLNIIYGENEAGKSTVQKFILGMLYGFKKPGGRREYTPDAERYRPWAGLDYRGSLTYTLDSGRQVRVERLFEPGRDMARVFDAVTGADLTAAFPLDRRKELLFAADHLGLDAEAFRSTAWVGQLAVGQLEAGRELIARVANLQESGREDLSVRQALAYIDEQVREIGTERAAAKPYGRVIKALGARRQELERAEAAYLEIRDWENALIELEAVLGELGHELEAARAEYDRALLAEAEERLALVADTTARLRELRAMADRLAEYAEFPTEGLLRLRQVAHEAEEAEAAATAWRERSGALAAEAAALGGAGPMARYGAEAARALEAANLAERTCAARLGALRELVARLRADLLAVAPVQAPFHWGVAVGVSLALALPVGLFVSPGAGGGVAAFLVALVVGLWRRQGGLQAERVKIRRQGLQAQLAGHEAEIASLEQEVEGKRAEAGRLANLAAPGAGADFWRLYADWQAAGERAASLDRQADEAARRAEAEGARAERAAAAAAALLAEAGVESAAAYEAACARREAREKALAEARALEGALATIPGDLEATVADLRARVIPGPVSRSSAALQEEIRRLEQRQAERKLRAGEIGARLETALRDMADPADLRRDLEALAEEKAGYDEELAALDLARETIAAVSGELHREFAPRLSQALGAVAAAVTAGRYSAVQVDEQAGLRVITPDDRTVELSQLSGGTVDQLYLGLRIALLDLVTAGQEALPLLLDDPFVQYDDRRAAAALAYLAEAARYRQVVLMTCHRREVDLASRTGLPFQLIALEDAAAEA